MINARIQEFSSGVCVCVCVGGGGGGFRSIWHIKKALTTFFFYFIFLALNLQLILQKSSGYFQRKLLFAKVPVGVEFFQGGGSNCFFPIETHKTCNFPGGQSPSGSAHVIPRIVV